MADIALIIKIDEEKYNQIINRYQGSNVRPKDYEIAIINGTPLPKGYGKIVDIGKIQSMARKKAEDCFPEGRYDYGYRKALFDFAKDIDDIPTIIEADKESEGV